MDEDLKVSIRRGSPEYAAWQQMKQRCTNERVHNYQHYGGRGITYCERWESFDNFLADMGRKPSAEHSLDRINNDGNYEPSNCRWADRSTQNQNRRCKGGVTQQYGKYGARVTINGRRYWLGYYETQAEAAAVREAVINHHRNEA